MLYVTTRSPATTRASPSTPGTAPVAAAPDHSVPRPAGPAHTPSRRAHRPGMSDIRSHRPPARTRRGQDRPLPSPSVPPSTTARHPASPPRLERGAAHPSVPRHTDGAHEQDQPRYHTDRHLGSLNEEWPTRDRHSERRSTEPTSVLKRISPAEQLRAEVDELFVGGQDLSRAVEEVARLGAQLLLQCALEAEVAAFLGRDRYQRATSCEDARVGMRNGYCPTTVKTTAGPVRL